MATNTPSQNLANMSEEELLAQRKAELDRQKEWMEEQKDRIREELRRLQEEGGLSGGVADAIDESLDTYDYETLKDFLDRTPGGRPTVNRGPSEFWTADGRSGLGDDKPILRPYCWLKLPSLEVWYHPEDPEDERDGKFYHLEKFEFEMGSDWVAKFTLTDPLYYITDDILHDLYMEEIKACIETGQSDEVERRHNLDVEFRFGYYVSDEGGSAREFAENPRARLGSSIDSIVFRGVIRSMTLNSGEGFHRYTINVAAPHTVIATTQNPTDDGKQELQKIESNKNLLEVLEADILRDYKFFCHPDQVVDLLEKTELISPIKVGEKSILQQAEELLTMHFNEEKEKNLVLRIRPCLGEEDIIPDGGKYDFVIEWFLVGANLNTTPDRVYRVGLPVEFGEGKDPRCSVIDFSPSIPNVQARGARTRSGQMNPAKADENIVSNKEEGDPSKAMHYDNKTTNTADRESQPTPKMLGDDQACKTHYLRDALSGFEADLTIIGDPGIFTRADLDGVYPGQIIEVLVDKHFRKEDKDRDPGPLGPKNNQLEWSKPEIDTLLTGVYIAERATHSMGKGQTFQTTLGLRRLNQPVEDSYPLEYNKASGVLYVQDEGAYQGANED